MKISVGLKRTSTSSPVPLTRDQDQKRKSTCRF